MSASEVATRDRIVSIVGAVTRQRLDPAGDVSREAVDGWDSLAHVEILFAIEEEFGIEFDEEAMARASSADNIAAEVARLGGSVT